MADMNKLLGQLLGSGAAGGFAGGLGGGLASNLLTSKSGRKMGKKALKMGGIAAVGALAYGAYQRYSTGKDTTDSALPQAAETELVPAPEGSAFMPAKNDPAGQEALGLTLVRAMIAAARADGRLDAKESRTIYQPLSKKLGLDLNGYHTFDFRYSVLQEQDIRWVIEVYANIHIACLDCDSYLCAFETLMGLDHLHNFALDG
jgi:uncharacterized membrane protein YebE (DUF533 family)